ncbi:MAG: hypothetical protein MSC31_13285 [Solirubrobacteraceae bacterium MAG38_C4-C5]|nr:hypothetical protein [Candidatus Siliceabacter maunaloa]
MTHARRRALGGSLLAAAALVAACGEEEPTAAGPPRVAPDGPTATGTATAPTPPPTAPAQEPDSGSPGGGEDVPGGGGAGDEGNRVPAVFELGPDDMLEPPTVSVPEFLGIRLEVRSSDDEAHRIELLVDPPVQLTVAPGGSAGLDVMGQREGRYALEVDGARAGTLVVGVEPGP